MAALSPQEALIYLMVVAASSDGAMTDRELAQIDGLIGRLPVFDRFERTRLASVANACADSINLTRRSYSTSTNQANRRASDAMRAGITGTSLSSTL